MKLLLDQNLSYRLVATLADVFPGALHVRDIGLDRSSDDVLWNHARDAGLTIVSKDSDFQHRGFVEGHPPKIVWLQVGNRSTGDIAMLLRQHTADIERFHQDPSASVLILR
jgi:predicted nuclease of predicted toxin-antitoxin system